MEIMDPIESSAIYKCETKYGSLEIIVTYNQIICVLVKLLRQSFTGLHIHNVYVPWRKSQTGISFEFIYRKSTGW